MARRDFRGTRIPVAVVLSTHPGARTWADFFDLMQTVDVPSDFMADRPMNVSPPERNLFAEDDR